MAYKLTYAVDGKAATIETVSTIQEAVNHCGNWIVKFLPLVQPERIEAAAFYIKIENTDTQRYVIYGIARHDGYFTNPNIKIGDFFVSLITYSTNEALSSGTLSAQIDFCCLNYYQAVAVAYEELNKEPINK